MLSITQKEQINAVYCIVAKKSPVSCVSFISHLYNHWLTSLHLCPLLRSTTESLFLVRRTLYITIALFSNQLSSNLCNSLFPFLCHRHVFYAVNERSTIVTLPFVSEFQYIACNSAHVTDTHTTRQRIRKTDTDTDTKQIQEIQIEIYRYRYTDTTNTYIKRLQKARCNLWFTWINVNTTK